MKDRGAFFRVSLAFLIVGIATLSIHFLRTGTSSAPDYRCSSDGELINFNIGKGDTGSEIASNLFKNGVIKSAESFFRVAVGDPRSSKIAPGVYRVTKGNCAVAVLNQLLSSENIVGLVTFLEGAWNSEIVEEMVSAGFERRQVISAMKVYPDGYLTSEGLLFPAHYSFPQGTSASDAISTMVDRGLFEIKRAGIASKIGKYSPQQLLIIASIIQAEGNTQDFGKIARVIFNRLSISMPLQLDSTVHYIKKVRGSIFLSTRSTLLKSPYNTYQRYGLPPGPIGNPGFDAMYAAANPAQGDWLYFITVAPTDTRFTNSLEEFNGWKILYKENLRKGLFRSAQ